jgi:dTDP-L-rhamnose 4-epimerase
MMSRVAARRGHPRDPSPRRPPATADRAPTPGDPPHPIERERILITGGVGFIGTALSRALVAEGHEVVVFDNLHPQVHGQVVEPTWLAAGVRFVHGHVTAADAWERVLRDLRPTAVVHLAAETGTGQSLAQATRHALVNVVGTTRLLDALWDMKERPHHIVLTSSRAVYGEGSWAAGEKIFYLPPRSHADLSAGRWEPISSNGSRFEPLPSRADRTEPRPANVYAATKLAQENICSAWAAATGVGLSIFRLQNVYGPGQSLINPYTGIVSLFAQLALARQPIELYEDGQIVRDFVFIEDVVTLLRKAIAQRPAQRRLLDVGSGVPATLEKIARLLAERAGAPSPFVSGRFRDGDVRAASCDLARTRAELGFEPAWDLHRGLRALLSWMSEDAPDGRRSALSASRAAARRGEPGRSRPPLLARPWPSPRGAG